jgi:N-acetyl-anhydromuramyl-L-alanine amidase AmpD
MANINPSQIYKFVANIEVQKVFWFFTAGEKTTYTVYITLASLLHFIETECGLYDGDSPQVKFDFNYDYFGLTNTGNTKVDRNYFFSPPNQFSADPRICLIPVHRNLNEIVNTLSIGSITNDTPLNPTRGGAKGYYNVAPVLNGAISSARRNEMLDFKTGNANAFVGKMGYILLNIEYLAGVLSSLTKEEDGVATLVKLLQQIMDDVNVCLGGINNFTVYSDRDTQTIRIYDQTPLNYGGSDYNSSRDTPDKFTTLNVFGVRPGVEGSFVQDIQLNSEISPNFSTAISVGAQANSTNVSQNAYSFEKYNKGLTDRIILEKVSKNSNGEKYKEGDAPFDLAKFKKIFTEVYGKRQLTDENIDYLKNANSQANILFLQKYSKDGNIDAPFFIPYNLNVTLDGISGIKLFEKFRMSKGVLPLTYDEGEIALIVKAISHTIDTKQWITKLETLSVPEASGSLKTYSIPTSTNTSTTESTSESTSSNPESWTDKTITSGFPLNPTGHSKRLVNKTGIILHYSAGSQKSDKGKSTIAFLNKKGLSYHYIIDATGHIEQLLPDKTIAYHAEGANQFTIGVSLLNYGYGKDINTSSYGTIPSNQTKNAQLVDWNEKPTTYREKTWSQEITDAQLNALKTLFVKLKQNNPGIPSYKWEGEKTWKQLFPNGISYTRASQGLFTHCSVTTQKRDCLPTPKIVKFFKELTL